MMGDLRTGAPARAGRGFVVFGCLAALTMALGGCAVQDAGVFKPQLAPVTSSNSELRLLPAPTKQVSVAVYEYKDDTGQFKDTTTVQTFSRAVTQGAQSILVNALQEAGNGRWFTVLDRGDLNNLLKERQIVSEMRRIYLGENRVKPQDLPPLMFAGIILEGGVIGYDTNTITGGLGAQYLGIGADTKYQQDTVTVSLRAVSIKTGEVLASVTTNKTIASVALDGNVFRFVEPSAILEVEAGYTKNEPKQLAVRQAIEKAVYALIMQGAHVGVWHFADRVKGQKLVSAYLAEKYGDVQAAQAVPAAVPPVTRQPTYIRPITPAEAAHASANMPAVVSAPHAAPGGPPPAHVGEKPMGALPPPANVRYAALDR
jgi:curli production assembly/transport component CsgG